MGDLEVNEKTKVTMPLPLFWSIVCFCCLACVSAAISYAHIDARLARIEEGTVQQRDLQRWVDELRMNNPDIKVPSLINEAITHPAPITPTTLGSATALLTDSSRGVK